jgi:hypothetical protein
MGSGFVISLLFDLFIRLSIKPSSALPNLNPKLLIAKQGALPETRGRLFARFHQAMDMSGHEGESIEQTSESFFKLSKEFKIKFPIFLPPEDSLAFIAPGNLVIKRPWKMNPWFPCHNFRISSINVFHQYQIT